MKTPQIIRSTLAACTVAIAPALFTGCATTPAARAAGMANNVTQTGKNLEVSKTAVSQALTTLNQLVAQPVGDMRSQYKAYLGSVNDLKAVSDRVEKSIKTLM